MNAATCFIVALVATSVCAAKDEEAGFLNDTNVVECRKIHKISDEDVSDLQSGKYPNKEDVKCFVKCWYEKSGFISEKGDIVKHAIKNFVMPFEKSDKIIKQLDECKDTKADTCETAYEFDKCLMKVLDM